MTQYTRLAVACALAALTLANPAAASRPAHARAARSLNATDTAHLHLVKRAGSSLAEEGPATGALPGTVSVSFELGPTITGRFTIHTHGGSITGTGSAKLHSSGLYASFGGTMSVSHGTGRYSHAHGHGGFYGTVNRHTYAAVIQTTGTLSY